MSGKVGEVYLVGAGPGDPWLFTFKGAELLSQADVIVYDRLIQTEIMSNARPDAERIYMGKVPGTYKSRQHEINQLLVHKALEGKTVVRLKGGDPLLFSRGGEEAQVLAQHGVPFEVVPGISSVFAAPAAAGIPVTHREMATTVGIVTGHERRDCTESRIDWEALARMDTLIVVMAVHSLGNICSRLTACGKSPTTPAALIQKATWPDQKVVFGTLQTVADLARENQVYPPATLVVGDVVGMHDEVGAATVGYRPVQAEDSQRLAPTGVGRIMEIGTSTRQAGVLKLALENAIFDHMQDATPMEELVRDSGLPPAIVRLLLHGLQDMGLVQSTDGGYGSTQLARRYLMKGSPDYLGDAFLAEVELAGALERLGDNGEGQDRVFENLLQLSLRAATPALRVLLRSCGANRVLVAGSGVRGTRLSLEHVEIDLVELSPGRDERLQQQLRTMGHEYDLVMLCHLSQTVEELRLAELVGGVVQPLRKGAAVALIDFCCPHPGRAPTELSLLCALARTDTARTPPAPSHLKALLDEARLTDTAVVPIRQAYYLVTGRKV